MYKQSNKNIHLTNTHQYVYFISLYKFPDKYEHIPDSSFDCIFKFYN